LPNEQVELGDGWWELAQSHEGRRRETLLLRAGSWYAAAKARLSTGLTLAKVEKRLREVERIGRPAPKAPTAAKTPKPRRQLAAGSILLVTFEPDTYMLRDNKVYVADLSGFGNHGVITGATPIPAGRAGAALKFGGQDSVVFPTLRTYLTRQLRQLSISVWLSPSQVDGVRFVFDVGYYGLRCISLLCSNGVPIFQLASQHGGAECHCDIAVAAGQWHHVVAVWDGTEQRVYVNGRVNRTKRTHDLTLNSNSVSTESARLGTQAKSRYRDKRYFRGLMDEIAIFPRALSEEEIQTLYQMGLDGNTLAKPGRTR